MTNVDIVFRYATQPSEAVLFALAGAREVYGVRHLAFDREAKTVRVEYDATRLSGPVVANLLRRAGLDIVEEVALVPPPPVEPVVTAAPQSSVPTPKA